MKLFVALSVTLLATYASASSVITMPLTKLRRSRDHSLTRLVRAPSGPTTLSATNLGYTQYATSVGIGHPPTYYNLVVGTGSSLTFCGIGNPYVRTSTSVPTGLQVSDTFALGNFIGKEYHDQVTLAPNLVVHGQSITDAVSASGFHGVDGILGLGPTDLTRMAVVDHPGQTIPTVMDNLVSQGLIKDKVFGIHFAPPSKENDANGALTFGGIDSGLFNGEPTYVPITETYPASTYWGINLTSSTYGNDHPIIRTSTAGIIDSGTTQILLADHAFMSYMKAIPGATYNSHTGLLEIPANSAQSLQPLHFVIGGQTFTMDAAAQLVPKDQSIAWGGASGKQYVVIGKFAGSGGGMEFVLGQAFIEQFYTIFDADAKRIGFAQAKS